MKTGIYNAVTVTLNAAIDQTLTIPEFTPGAVNRVKSSRSDPGGKGVNVASSLADHGLKVAVTGFLGTDNSASFDELFKEKNIANYFVRIPGLTRVGVKIADPVRNETTDINFPGLPPSPEDQRMFAALLKVLDADWFILSGSVPPGVDKAFYKELIVQLKASGKKVLLDASGDPLLNAVAAAPAIIKPNVAELEELMGRKLPEIGDVVGAARQLVSTGIALVVVSMGERGACFVTASEALLAVPPKIEITSTTVGAGDAMVAGIVTGQFRGLSLAETARLATASSLALLTKSGRESVADFVAQTTISPL
ncbi:MAG TPA: 1-phosphofructokinase [Chthoniobacterales bacterium]